MKYLEAAENKSQASWYHSDAVKLSLAVPYRDSSQINIT